MTMTSIGIEQNGHTAWNAFIEGGAGMINRRQTVRAVDFAGIISEIAEGWAKVNDRDVVAVLRLVREQLEVREDGLMRERVRAAHPCYPETGVGLDTVDPCDPKVTGPEVWQAQDPEIWGERETARTVLGDEQPQHPLDEMDGPPRHIPFNSPVVVRRGPGRPRKVSKDQSPAETDISG